MTDELKPCPFCGKMPEKILKKDRGTRTGFDVLVCRTDGCTNSNVHYDANKKWNTRPLEDALRAELEAANKTIADQSATIGSMSDEADWGGGMVEENERLKAENERIQGRVDRAVNTLRAIAYNENGADYGIWANRKAQRALKGGEA